MKPVLIFGASSFGRLAHHYLTQELGREVIAFVVDAAYVDAAPPLPAPVLGWEDALANHPPAAAEMFTAIGYRNMRARKSLFDRVVAAGYDVPAIIAPRAYVATDAQVGTGSFIMPGAVVETGAKLGANTIIWSNATICHDAQVGDHAFIGAGSVLGGFASVGTLSFLGFSTTVLQDIAIAEECLIGAGSLIREDTQPLSVYVGAPARKTRSIDPDKGVEVA